MESPRSADPPFLHATAIIGLNPIFLPVPIDNDCKQMLEWSFRYFQKFGTQYAKDVLQTKFTLAISNLEQTGYDVEANEVV